jgi:hypothetical protein
VLRLPLCSLEVLDLDVVLTEAFYNLAQLQVKGHAVAWLSHSVMS